MAKKYTKISGILDLDVLILKIYSLMVPEQDFGNIGIESRLKKRSKKVPDS